MTKSTRRVHDAAFKTKVVLEALKGVKTLAQLSSDFGIHAQQITTGLASQWKRQALDGSSRERPNPVSLSSSENRSKGLFFSRLDN